MKLNLEIEGRSRTVEIESRDRELFFRIDGRSISADAAEVEPGVFSVLIGGEAFEVHVEFDSGNLRLFIDGHEYPVTIADPRRWRHGSRGVAVAEGRQKIVAPMPGKIVRVMVHAGDVVEMGQGLLVVEAMKMQNEIKSPKAGKVERLDACDGKTVNAGDILAVIA